MKRFLLLIVALLVLFPFHLQADEFFEKQVRPLLVAKCYQCHAGKKQSGGLSLETKAGWAKGGESGPAIIPGDVAGSLLIDAINYRGVEMPPADEGGKLKPEEIGILTKWVQNGAVDPRVAGQQIGGMSRADAKTWWSYQPITDVEPGQSPQVIDQLINRRLQAQGLSAHTAASRRELIRRATYDLTGLPPTYRIRTGQVPECIPSSDQSAAGVQGIWRTLGTPLVGCDPLCRYGRREFGPTVAARMAF